MILMRVHLHRSWQIKLLLVLFAFIGVYSIAFFVVYHTTAARIKADEVDNVETYLHKGANEINSLFSTYWWKIIPAIERMPEVKELCIKQDELYKTSYAKLIKLRSKLEVMPELNHSEIVFMLFFDSANGFACTSSAIFDNFRNTISQDIISINDLSYDRFISLVRDEAISSFRIQQPIMLRANLRTDRMITKDDYLTVIRKLSLRGNYTDVYAIWMMPITSIQKTLVGDSSASGALSLSRNSNVIYSNTSSNEFDYSSENVYYNKYLGKTFLNVNLSSLGLTCTLAVEDNTVLARIKHFCQLSNGLFFSFILFSTILTAIAAIYYITPLQRLYLRLFEPTSAKLRKKGNIVVQLDGKFKELSDTQRQLKGQLDQWQSVLHNTLIIKLLKRSYISPSEHDIIESLPGLQDNSEFKVLIIGCVIDATDMTSDCEYEEIIKRHLPHSIVSTMARDCYMILLYGNLTAQQPLHLTNTIFYELLDEINNTTDGTKRFAIGVGLTYAGIYNASKSYEEAIKAYHEAELLKKSSVIEFTATETSSSRFSLSYNEIMKMQSLLETGDPDGAAAILDEAVADMFAPENCNCSTILICQQLYYDITGIFMRLPYKEDIWSIISAASEFDVSISLCDLVSKIKMQMFLVANIITSKAEINDNLSKDIIEYIVKHYNDPDLSLTKLAEVFSMSERSLSRHFKTN
jgi:hypothetical protein